jgi:hypothetical protein
MVLNGASVKGRGFGLIRYKRNLGLWGAVVVRDGSVNERNPSAIVGPPHRLRRCPFTPAGEIARRGASAAASVIAAVRSRNPPTRRVLSKLIVSEQFDLGQRRPRNPGPSMCSRLVAEIKTAESDAARYLSSLQRHLRRVRADERAHHLRAHYGGRRCCEGPRTHGRPAHRHNAGTHAIAKRMREERATWESIAAAVQVGSASVRRTLANELSPRLQRAGNA